ncbi:ComEA family DNA-binding protein [Flagellimonas sp. S174]|uniref:ComEA family DNA-binding protein n=1 Tax=Flagellimonas sp. S174 TaxID=3410790 RepID=UPI003BF4D2FF
MKSFKSHFRFTKQERNGIFFLVLLIVLLQMSYFLISTHTPNKGEEVIVDVMAQQQIDSLKQIALADEGPEIYPFNPNFITDYKGYTLGMSPKEIDRLIIFRETGKYVNSVSEFQQVTQISDSLLSSISPYFKFPEWTQKRSKANVSGVSDSNQKNQPIATKKIIDLNKATSEELTRIYGIGEKLSARIVKFRDRLGGFLVNEQLYDVYGLEIKIADKTLKQFQVLSPPSITKLKVNSASVDELASLVYISKKLANQIVAYRNENGPFETLQDLGSVPDFPITKIDRIGLYLSLSND